MTVFDGMRASSAKWRTAAVGETRHNDGMDDKQLIRYSRHILLPEIDIDGQQRLLDSHALIVGAGGLGSPVALYLAASGVGTLTLCDDDDVDLTNLQRQIAHATDRIGVNKAASARERMLELNPDVVVHAVAERLEGEALQSRVAAADIVLDCCDNFATRHAVNRVCVAAGTPLVSGAAVRFDGQLAVFDYRLPGMPCYHCLFPDEGDASDGPCALFGVLAPLVGVIGSLQAMEAVKLLAGIPSEAVGRLQMLDGKSGEWRRMKLVRDPGCPVCGVRGTLP